MLSRITLPFRRVLTYFFRHPQHTQTTSDEMEDQDPPPVTGQKKPHPSDIPNHFHDVCIPCYRGGKGDHGGRSIYKYTEALLHSQERCPKHCRWDAKLGRYLVWADKDLVRKTELHLAPLLTDIIAASDDRTLPEVNWHRLRTATGTENQEGVVNKFKDWMRETAATLMHKTMKDHHDTKNSWDYLLNHNPDLLNDDSDDYSTPGDTTESEDSDEANNTKHYNAPSHGRDFGVCLPMMEDEGPNAVLAQRQAYKIHRRIRRATKKAQKRTTATTRQVTRKKLGTGHLSTTALENITVYLGGTHSDTASSSTTGPTGTAQNMNTENMTNTDWTSVDSGTIGNLTTSMNSLNLETPQNGTTNL